MNEKHTGERLYAVEILRALFILGIVFDHLSKQICPSLASDYQAIFHTSRHWLWFGVDGFFIIGGFFLYRVIAQRKLPPHAHISKLWGRLVPAMFLSFIIISIGLRNGWHGIGWWKFVDILFLLPGTGAVPEVIYNSEWFVCVYFYVSCFIIGLFNISHKTAWTVLGVLMYFTLMLLLHAKPVRFSNSVDALYYALVSRGICKGIFCMGLGVIASFLSEQLVFSTGKICRLVATGVELIAFYMLLSFMFRTSEVHFSSLEVWCILAVLMVVISRSLGYISALLNRMSQVQYVTRYTYSFLFGHATMIALIRGGGGIQIHNTDAVAVVIIGGIVFALFEYHVIEGWLVPKIKLWFRGAPETNKSLE